MNNAYFVKQEKYQDIYDKIEQNSAIDSLEELTLYNRINTLSTIYHAKHGWLGASLSIAEIVTALYFYYIDKNREDLVLLSKGHAAVMQYAALAGLNYFDTEKLLDYKQPHGPQAHTDIQTPGIPINSGSLGQALSKAFGMGYQANRKVYVIMGDGELQEGQNFEAFMTLTHYKMTNVIPIIDRNGIQSDSNVDDIKGIKDLPAVLKGIGFEVIHINNGNDIKQVMTGLDKANKATLPTVIIADTCKGAGISFMSADSTERREYGWHGGIPSNMEYEKALKELAEQLRHETLSQEIIEFCKTISPEEKIATVKKPISISTGTAFSNCLLDLAVAKDNLIVLDADLEKSCRLTAFAEKYPKQYLEMGISEQDMVSTAGGLALNGKLPVVNTYGSFFRRAFEQVYVNATEKTKVIYAGHYSGLCYTTDGKTHQCTGDVAMMRSLPRMIVLYPTFNEEIPQMLDWYINNIKDQPLYIRLHRTPFLEQFQQPETIKFSYGYGIPIIQNNSHDCIITSGPHMTAFCSKKANTEKADLYTMSSMDFAASKFLESLAQKYQKISIIEELIHAGGLLDLLTAGFAKLIDAGIIDHMPTISHKAVDDFTISDKKTTGLYERFGLTAPML